MHKIIIADDHQILIQGILAVLKDMDDVEVIATVNNGTELMQQLKGKQPDLVVLDLNMPGPDGLSILKELKDIYANLKVFVLTSYNQPDLIQQVKKLGASGYMVKNLASSELLQKLRIVLDGGSSFPLPQEESNTPSNSIFFDDFLKKHHLTKREVGIIKMICAEMSSREIAEKLFLSELTIKTHRRNIMRKLDIKSVAGLINFAIENDLLEEGQQIR